MRRNVALVGLAFSWICLTGMALFLSANDELSRKEIARISNACDDRLRPYADPDIFPDSLDAKEPAYSFAIYARWDFLLGHRWERPRPDIRQIIFYRGDHFSCILFDHQGYPIGEYSRFTLFGSHERLAFWRRAGSNEDFQLDFVLIEKEQKPQVRYVLSFDPAKKNIWRHALTGHERGKTLLDAEVRLDQETNRLTLAGPAVGDALISERGDVLETHLRYCAGEDEGCKPLTEKSIYNYDAAGNLTHTHRSFGGEETYTAFQLDLNARGDWVARSRTTLQNSTNVERRAVIYRE
ncbi:hypothetical protein [Pelagibius sp. Alg239-R121]|uniref:hypothetical protein n=1 Tax=Pelagibius sp. Alg239-R121 TaxID=2993448 RepID=UPI0024A628F4|nr:hypothetical protein [Pelagibius sp. Alg239-R121]